MAYGRKPDIAFQVTELSTGKVWTGTSSHMYIGPYGTPAEPCPVSKKDLETSLLGFFHDARYKIEYQVTYHKQEAWLDRVYTIHYDGESDPKINELTFSIGD